LNQQTEIIQDEVEFREKGLSHGPSPGSLAGDPFGVKMETIERKLQNNITERKTVEKEDLRGSC